MEFSHFLSQSLFSLYVYFLASHPCLDILVDGVGGDAANLDQPVVLDEYCVAGQVTCTRPTRKVLKIGHSEKHTGRQNVLISFESLQKLKNTGKAIVYF